MPSVYQIKPAFQQMLRPAVRVLASAGVTANQVTIAACVLSLAVGYRASLEPRIWAWVPAVLFLRMALNAMDGMLAREYGQASRLGGILNELTDVISDAALLYPFLFLDPFWMLMTIFLSVLTEFTGVLAPVRRYEGPFGKSDRALFFGALACWYAADFPIRRDIEQALPKLAALLCLVTIGNRLRTAL